jgi:hypothetical protein
LKQLFFLQHAPHGGLRAAKGARQRAVGQVRLGRVSLFNSEAEFDHQVNGMAEHMAPASVAHLKGRQGMNNRRAQIRREQLQTIVTDFPQTPEVPSV